MKSSYLNFSCRFFLTILNRSIALPAYRAGLAAERNGFRPSQKRWIAQAVRKYFIINIFIVFCLAFSATSSFGLSTPGSITYPSTDSDGNFTVSWSSVSGASNYQLWRSTNSGFSPASVVYNGSGTSYNQTGLSNGTYYYRVLAYNSSDASDWRTGGAIVVGCTKPSTPASITYPSTDSDGNFTVSWSSVSGASNYQLWRSTNSGFSPASVVYNGSGTSYNQTGLSAGTYYYRVAASNNCGASDWRTGGAIVVGCMKPSTPASITYPSTDSDGNFTVSWSSVSGASNYQLWRSTNSGFSPASVVYNGSGTSYNQTGLSNGTYYYRVAASNDCGASDWRTGGAIVVGCMKPSTPASITYPSTDSDGNFTVSWSSVSGASNYQLWRSTNSGFSPASVVYNGSGTSYNQTGLSNGTYYYRVAASNDCGASDWRTGGAIVVGCMKPSTPASITYPSTDSDGNFTVSWSSVSGASNYQLWRSTNSGFSPASVVYNGSGTSYNQTGLSNGTYYYRVAASNDCGASDWRTGGAIAITSGCTKPSTPASITYPSTDSDGNFTVSWSSVSGASNYQLWRSTNSGFSPASVVYNGSGTSYNQTGLSNGTYYYRVAASNDCGASDWRTGGAIAITSGCTKPSTPASITYPSTDSDGNFTVSWSSVSGASNYQLWRSTNSGFSPASVVYNGSGTSYSQTGLSAGTYYYRVVASNSCGASDWRTGGAIAITSGCTKPSTPASITYPSTDSDGNFTVNWSSVSGASSYQLWRSTNSGFSPASVVYNGSGTSYSQTGLSAGTYYYRVVASNSCGASDWRTGGAIAITSGCTKPSTPASITYPSTDSDGNFTVSWSSASGASSYQLWRSTNSGFSPASVVYNGSGTSYSQTGLSAGTYYYRVIASNDCGASDWCYGNAIIVGSPKPSTPSPIFPGWLSSPGLEISDTTPTLFWTISPEATSYNFRVRDLNTDVLVVDIAGHTSTSYTTASLTPGHKYSWNVQACNAAGCSSYSAYNYFQIVISAPTAVGIPSITEGLLNSYNPPFIDYYTFKIGSPMFVTISLFSIHFDTFLILKNGAGDKWEDDNGHVDWGNDEKDDDWGTNSEISRELTPGTYTIEVTTNSEFKEGDLIGSYTLVVRDIQNLKIEPICEKRGEQYPAVFPGPYWSKENPNFWIAKPYLIGGDSCFGRCGLGCPVPLLDHNLECGDAYRYTIDCLNHDACVDTYGFVAWQCNHLFDNCFEKLGGDCFYAEDCGGPFYVDPHSGSCDGDPNCYSNIQDALNNANPGETIKIAAGIFDEDLIADEPKNLILEGGFEDTYSNQTSDSRIKSLTIKSGKITVDGLVIE